MYSGGINLTYTQERLQADLAITKTWLEHEQKKIEECEDEYTKDLLQVRANMYQENIKNLEIAIANLSSTSIAPEETDPGFQSKKPSPPPTQVVRKY